MNCHGWKFVVWIYFAPKGGGAQQSQKAEAALQRGEIKFTARFQKDVKGNLEGQNPKLKRSFQEVA